MTRKVFQEGDILAIASHVQMKWTPQQLYIVNEFMYRVGQKNRAAIVLFFF